MEEIMYKTDHIKVLKVLSAELPKRPTFKTSDIVEKGFKRVENGDRRVRNAYRKLRKEGHVEISERGEYQLTAEGATFCKEAAKAGWKMAPPVKEKTKKAPEKKAKAKPVKKTNKKVAKKAKPEAKKAKPAKKPEAKKAKPATKKATKKAAKSKPKAEATGGNNVPAETKKESSASAQLSF